MTPPPILGLTDAESRTNQPPQVPNTVEKDGE